MTLRFQLLIHAMKMFFHSFPKLAERPELFIYNPIDNIGWSAIAYMSQMERFSIKSLILTLPLISPHCLWR